MRNMLSLLALLLCGIASCPAPVQADGSRAEYRRAAALANHFRGNVRNQKLHETWIDNELLVYRLQDANGGWQHLRVDVATGKPQPAFDHAAVAKQLNELTKTVHDAKSLDVRIVGRTSKVLHLQKGDRVFGVHAETSKVTEVDLLKVKSLHLPPNAPARSVGGGIDTSILFVNRSSQDVRIWWLDHSGQGKEYGSVAAGASRSQHTFRGHTWRVHRADGAVFGPYRAKRAPGVVVIPKGAPPTPKKTQRRDRALSPEGKQRVFVRDHDVYLRNVASKKETRLTEDGDAQDGYVRRWSWSPNGRYVCVVKEEPGQQRIVHVVNSTPKAPLHSMPVTYEYRKPGDRIDQPHPMLIDVRTRKRIALPTDLYDQPWSINHFSWSNDGERFRFLYNQRGHQHMRLIELDAKKATVRAVVDESSETFINYSQKTFLRSIDDGKAWIWMSERSGRNHLYRVDDKTGQASPITKGDWIVRRVQHVDNENGTVRFEAMGVYPEQDPYHVHVGRIGLDGKNLTWLTEGDGTHSLAFSPDGAHYVDTWSRVDLPPVNEVRRTNDGSLVCELGRADWAPLQAKGWQPTQRFHAKGRDGKTDIWGVLHLPTHFDPKLSYPVIESIYAGPHGHFVPKSFQLWSTAKTIAELGFVVVQIDGMGTNWRDKAFHDVCWKNLGDSGFPDRILWMQAAAKTRPYMDVTRVGIYGGSAGGQSAMRALLVHGDFYKVGVADCGCHDNRVDKIWWNEAWMGWPIGPHYAAQSNVTQAHRLTGRLLLTVGEVDRNVDPASTMHVVNALIEADKDFDLIVFPGRGHGAGESKYGQRRRADFFVRHLRGGKPSEK